MACTSARQRLLDIAADIVVREGVAALTYEHLAAASGVSKGGLLYHFPSKAQLVEELLDDALDSFDAAVERRATAPPSGPERVHEREPGVWARAYVEATFDVASTRPQLATAVLLASRPDDLELATRCASRFSLWQARLQADGLPADVAAAVRYACDGWWAQRIVLPAAADADADVLRRGLHEQLDHALRCHTAAAS